MGATASIEVSFIDKKTGEFLSNEDINDLTNQAQNVIKEFDFSKDFYKNYNDPEKYRRLAEQWKLTQTNR